MSDDKTDGAAGDEATDAVTAAPPAPEGVRSYFKISDDGDEFYRAPKFDWVNKRDLNKPGYVLLAPGPYERGRGFFPFSAPPKIVFKKKGKRQPLDYYKCDRVWLISNRLKVLLEELDGAGFEFVRTDTIYDEAKIEEPPYWLCDVTRVLECVDEHKSEIRYHENTPWKGYAGFGKVVMKPDVIGSAHVFEVVYHPHAVIVDDSFQTIVRTHKITGFNFYVLDGSHRVLNGQGERVG